MLIIGLIVWVVLAYLAIHVTGFNGDDDEVPDGSLLDNPDTVPAVRRTSREDLFIWSDGTVCTRDELPYMGHMSDDHEAAPVGSPRWHELTEAGNA